MLMLVRSFFEFTRSLFTSKLWKHNNKIIIIPEQFLYYILFEMSSMPQSAFITMKIRKNMDTKKEYISDNTADRTATNYNSKFMNSIWGMYNRYAVHNLKKNIDKVGTTTNYSIPH